MDITPELSVLVMKMNAIKMIPRNRYTIVKLSVFVFLFILLIVLVGSGNNVQDTNSHIVLDRDTWHNTLDDPGPYHVHVQESEASELADISVNVTNVVNPHPFRLTLSPYNLCETNEHLLVMIYIPSRPGNFRQRDVIRRTWGSMDTFSSFIRIAFIMGREPGESDGMRIALKAEAKIYNDIIQEDFMDTYRNLTYKDICALKWVSSHCSNANFIVKADDDLIVDMFTLIRVLSVMVSVPKEKPGLWCRLWVNMEVQRDGKWRVNQTEYSNPYYPPYCSGMAYIMTPAAAKALYIASYEVPYFWLEDVYITGLLAKHIKLFPVDMGTYFVLKPEYLLRQKYSAVAAKDGYGSAIFAHSTMALPMSSSVWANIVHLEDHFGKFNLPVPKNDTPTTTTNKPESSTVILQKVKMSRGLNSTRLKLLARSYKHKHGPFIP